MRLHIGEAAAENRLGAVNGELFHDIHVFAAAVVTPARIALGIFIRQHRALGLQDRTRDNIFRGNELYLALLALQLVRQRCKHFWIPIHAILGKKSIFVG